MRLSGFADEISPDFEIQLRTIQRLGLSYMEVRGINGRGADTWDTASMREYKRRMDAAGICASCLASPVGKVGIEEDFRPHMERFKHVVELAHILDAPYIRIFSFYMPEAREPEEFEDQVIDRLGAMASYGELGGIMLLHENEKGIFGDRAGRCLKLMEALSGKNLGLAFDFANFIQCGQEVMEAYRILEKYIRYVHIKDALSHNGAIVPAGMGEGRIEKILASLKEGGYQGFLSLEPHLAEFEGLKALERDGASLKGMQRLSGEQAFETAFAALKEILERISWQTEPGHGC